MRNSSRPRRLSLPIVLLLSLGIPAGSAELKFERAVIDDDFPGGYQVEIADVNGDGKLDVIGVGGGACAWYENPSWKKRVVSTAKRTPGIIRSASGDIDGDGRPEVVAIGGRTHNLVLYRAKP